MKQEILETLHHRPPYLQIEDYEEIKENKIKIKRTLKKATFYFAGHFPGAPVVPGAMMCEMLFQSSCLLLSKLQKQKDMAIGVVTKIKNAKFKGFLRPGDDITLEVEVLAQVGDQFQMKGVILKGEAQVAVVTFNCANIPSEKLLN